MWTSAYSPAVTRLLPSPSIFCFCFTNYLFVSDYDLFVTTEPFQFFFSIPKVIVVNETIEWSQHKFGKSTKPADFFFLPSYFQDVTLQLRPYTLQTDKKFGTRMHVPNGWKLVVNWRYMFSTGIFSVSETPSGVVVCVRNGVFTLSYRPYNCS